jgi:hypothetical protein
MTTAISDIPTSWRTVLLNPSHKPDATVTTSHTMISSDMSVTIPATGAQDALAVRQWIDQHVKPHRRPRFSGGLRIVTAGILHRNRVSVWYSNFEMQFTQCNLS